MSAPELRRRGSHAASPRSECTVDASRRGVSVSRASSRGPLPAENRLSAPIGPTLHQLSQQQLCIRASGCILRAGSLLEEHRWPSSASSREACAWTAKTPLHLSAPEATLQTVEKPTDDTKECGWMALPPHAAPFPHPATNISTSSWFPVDPQTQKPSPGSRTKSEPWHRPVACCLIYPTLFGAGRPDVANTP
jgi:hypothetical protein